MMSTDDLGVYEKVKGVNSVIKILGAPNNSTPGEEVEMEEVDANTVETFTLDEFRSIILECRNKEIDFIIARVTTPDPYDQTTIYNFYYAASEINRVLFRFETDRRLLHRMKVRNPLNNMYILGQVYYYKITVDEVDRAFVDYYFNNTSEMRRKSRIKAFSAVFRPSTDSQKKLYKKESISKDANDSITSSSKYYDSQAEQNPKETLEKVKKGDLQLEPVVSDKKLVYNAYYFATDDDFLMQGDVREYFRRNTLDKDDDFLFEIDRTQNDFFALLESNEEEENEEVVGWKRILTAHVSLLITLLGVCLLFSTGPLVILIALPLALVLFLSFMSSIVYILFCRQNTFDTLAVQSVEEV